MKEAYPSFKQRLVCDVCVCRYVPYNGERWYVRASRGEKKRRRGGGGRTGMQWVKDWGSAAGAIKVRSRVLDEKGNKEDRGVRPISLAPLVSNIDALIASLLKDSTSLYGCRLNNIVLNQLLRLG